MLAGGEITLVEKLAGVTKAAAKWQNGSEALGGNSRNQYHKNLIKR